MVRVFRSIEVKIADRRNQERVEPISSGALREEDGENDPVGAISER